MKIVTRIANHELEKSSHEIVKTSWLQNSESWQRSLTRFPFFIIVTHREKVNQLSDEGRENRTIYWFGRLVLSRVLCVLCRKYDSHFGLEITLGR